MSHAFMSFKLSVFGLMLRNRSLTMVHKYFLLRLKKLEI